MMKTMRLVCAALAAALLLAGCMSGGESRDGTRWYNVDTKLPEIPEKLKHDDDGTPLVRVFDVEKKAVSEMDVESYVMGVVAGEMKNDWPIEALKAQAILARTFVLKFCSDKDSKYEGADISTDVTEAQAYAADDINARVRQAINGTRGLVMSYEGAYPYAWFHAHSGGMTELPSVSLDFREGDPGYLKPVESRESDDAPESAREWTAEFTVGELRKACADAGLKVENVESIEIGEKGESGRAKTLLVNGKPVSAASLRIRIGANKMRSTLIDSIELDGGSVTFKGRGFGHGVGMSQWGAYAMAKDGVGAEEIVRHYFRNVDIVELW